MKIPDMDTGKRFLVAAFLVFELLLVGLSLWPVVVFVQYYASASRTAASWAVILIGAVVLFNYSYAVLLLLVRIVLPKPPEGFFPRQPDGRPPREALLLMMNLLLVKARFHTPWSSMITSLITNIFPLAGPFRHFFGPHTRTVTMGDVYVCLDPYLMTAGSNVQFGFDCLIICHLFDNRGLLIRGVSIGDDAVVGGKSLIMPGVTIGHHAVVGARSLVATGTDIKPYEFWAGTPARKIRDIQPQDAMSMDQDQRASG